MACSRRAMSLSAPVSVALAIAHSTTTKRRAAMRDDHPRVGMQVVKRAFSFFARGDTSTGFLQHFSEGAVVVQCWKLSLKPRGERQQGALQTCAEWLTVLVQEQDGMGMHATNSLERNGLSAVYVLFTHVSTSTGELLCKHRAVGDCRTRSLQASPHPSAPPITIVKGRRERFVPEIFSGAW